MTSFLYENDISEKESTSDIEIIVIVNA